MSHFYAIIQGHRGAATRQGTAKGGMYAHIRGWNVGARVMLNYNPLTGKDEVVIEQTGGSNNGSTVKTIAKIIES